MNSPLIVPHEEAPQGSDAWFELRLGIPTASEFKRIIKANGDPSESRSKYIDELAHERLTGMMLNKFQASAMKRGKLMEPESRESFEFENDVTVDQVAFVFESDARRFGCSPDGLIGDNDGFETKDAIPRIHLERLEKNTLPSEHFHQVQGCLYVCQRERWHYRSYCRGMRPFDIVINRDEGFIKKLASSLELFCDELDSFVEKCRRA